MSLKQCGVCRGLFRAYLRPILAYLGPIFGLFRLQLLLLAAKTAPQILVSPIESRRQMFEKRNRRSLLARPLFPLRIRTKEGTTTKCAFRNGALHSLARSCAVRLPGPAGAARSPRRTAGRRADCQREEWYGGMAALVLGSHSSLWWKGQGREGGSASIQPSTTEGEIKVCMSC